VDCKDWGGLGGGLVERKKGRGEEAERDEERRQKGAHWVGANSEGERESEEQDADMAVIHLDYTRDVCW